MTPTTVKNLQFLPFGWEGKSALNSNTYIAPNETQAKIFLKGATETLINNAKALRKNILICYRTSKNEIKTLKHFYFLASQCYNPKQTNNKEIKTEEIMTITSNDVIESYGTNIVTLTSCQSEVDDFINNKTKQGLSVRLVRNKDDKYLIYTNQQRLYSNENVNANDFLGTISGPLGAWRDSFLPGAINYYEKLHDVLYQDSFIPQFVYELRTYYGALAQFSTDYYLVRYNGDVCRLSVQDYKNVRLLSNDIA